MSWKTRLCFWRKCSTLLFFFAFAFFVIPASAEAATLYWVGADGANASVASNWKTTNPTTCGSGDSGAAPTTGDTVNFDADCDNGASWDSGAAATIAVFNMNSGYTGTVTLARSLQTTSTFTQSGGTFNSSSQTLDVDTTFTLDSGITQFTASSGTMTVGGFLTINADTSKFSANGGTITIDGAGEQTLSCNNVTFNLVSISGPTASKTVNSNCSLPLGNNPAIQRITLHGTLSGTGSMAIGISLNMNAGSALSGFTGLSGQLLFIAGATFDASSYTINMTSSGGEFRITSGSFTAPTGTMSLRSFTRSGGTFNHNNGTVSMTLGPGTLTCGGALLNNLIFNSTITISGDCSLADLSYTSTNQSVNNPASPTTLNISGDFSQTSGASGTLGGSNLTLEFSGSDNQTISKSGAGTFASVLKVNKSGGAVNLSTSFAPSGQTCTVTEGTFDLNGQAFTCGSTFTIEDGGNLQLQGGESPTTPVLNSGSTVTYDGTSSYTIKDWGYHHLTIAGSGGTFATPNSTEDVNGNFTLSNGTFTAPSGAFTIAGNFAHSGGTYTHNSGTVTLDGTDQTISGSSTFNNLTKTVTTARTLTFPASATQTIAGTMTLQGASGNLLSLRSSTTDTQWRIDPQGTRTVSYLDLKDSHNINATEIPTVGLNITDSGNNTGWTFDTAGPVLSLDSPGDYSYTNSDRPAFKWKQSTDELSSVSDYELIIDNPSAGSGQPSGDFTISDIPVSGTSDYETNKYVVRYENFSDSDSTNNYLAVYTKSHSDWGTSENDGKLREGRVSWKVRATDSIGNVTEASRTLFVDRTSPNVAVSQINDTPYTGNDFSTTDSTPTLFGKITDPLSGGDPDQTQDENGPRVASGPNRIEIKIEHKNGSLYDLHTIYTINMDKPWYSCDNKEVSDNSKQKCDKYLPFEYVQKVDLDRGSYRITLTGKDKADNSTETSFTLNITTFAQVAKPEEEPSFTSPDEASEGQEPESVSEELEITQPAEQLPQASIFNQIWDNMTTIMTNIFNTFNQATNFALAFLGGQIQIVSTSLGNGIAFVFNATTQTISSGLAYAAASIRHSIQLTLASLGQGLATTQSLFTSVGQAIGSGYNLLAESAPGVVGTILTGIGNGVSTITIAISTVAQNVASGTVSLANSVATTAAVTTHNGGVAIVGITNGIANTTVAIAKNTLASMESGAQKTGAMLAQVTQKTFKGAQDSMSDLAFGVGEKTQDVSDRLGLGIIKFTYNFVSEPTTIHDVQAEALSPTSVKVSWHTNHPANGKVNYGFDEGDYEFEEQTEKRTTSHEFILTDLTPNTEYHYEVMSHNKNYVYDANRKFTTPEE